MHLEPHSRPKLARGVRLQMDKQTGEPMLLFPEGVLFLSGTASEIVSQCTGKRTLEDIIASLAEEYEVEREVLCQDVLDCLSDLYQRKLLLFQ